MDWSNDMVMEFLRCYESEPVIWNPKHENHSKKYILNQAWERIKNNISWESNVEGLKRKKDSLMAYYRIHKNKINKSKYSNNEDSGYKTIWFAFDTMDAFLGHLYDEGPATTDSEESGPAAKLPTRACGTRSSASQARNKINKRRKSIDVRDTNVNTIHKKHSTPITEHDESCSASMIDNNEKSINECDLYGQLLAHKLMKLGEHDRLLMMHDIDNLVFDAIIQAKDKSENEQKIK